MKLDLFTKNNCIQCKMTKKFLKQHNNTSGSFCDNLLQTLEHFAPLKERSDDIAILFIEF